MLPLRISTSNMTARLLPERVKLGLEECSYLECIVIFADRTRILFAHRFMSRAGMFEAVIRVGLCCWVGKRPNCMGRLEVAYIAGRMADFFQHPGLSEA